MTQKNKIPLLIMGLVFLWPCCANSEVNSTITDSIAESNVKVVGEAPAESMGNMPLQTTEKLMQNNSIAECQFESDHCACITNRLLANTYNAAIINNVLKKSNCPTNQW